MTMTLNPDSARADGRLHFDATDVTGSRTLGIEVQPELPAETVATTVAGMMTMPSDVAFVLRDDLSGAFLENARPIGEQLAPGASTTLVPMTHLGAPRQRETR